MRNVLEPVFKTDHQIDQSHAHSSIALGVSVQKFRTMFGALKSHLGC
jgi:hypothetical protein